MGGYWHWSTAGRPGEANRLTREGIGVLGIFISAGGANEHWDDLSSVPFVVIAVIDKNGEIRKASRYGYS